MINSIRKEHSKIGRENGEGLGLDEQEIRRYILIEIKKNNNLKIKLTISPSSETSQKSTDISNRLSETKDMVVNLIIYVKELVASGTQ
jgi:hypothetical protein